MNNDIKLEVHLAKNKGELITSEERYYFRIGEVVFRIMKGKVILSSKEIDDPDFSEKIREENLELSKEQLWRVIHYLNAHHKEFKEAIMHHERKHIKWLRELSAEIEELQKAVVKQIEKDKLKKRNTLNQ